MKTHMIKITPGEEIEIKLTEKDGESCGHIRLFWQERDAPIEEIANKGRELQIGLYAFGGAVGPIITTHG